jgi:DNA-binding MarR family transcriptional regulator
MTGSPLTLPLNHLLDAVVAEPGVTATAIAGRLGKSQQAISQAADRLQRLGFIERRVGPGRSVALFATEAGRAASADGVDRELASETRIREALGGERYDDLIARLSEASVLLGPSDHG